MNKFKEIILLTWSFAALAFLVAVFVCAFVPEFSKDELSFSILGLGVSVLTLIALFK